MAFSKPILNSGFKLGVLGGGQLGKMLGLAAANWHLPLYFLDQSADFPAGLVSPHFQEGDFAEAGDVLAFGADKDLLTIEIEHVNTEALIILESRGLKIHPRPQALEIIKDKGLQKQFYQQHGFPTASFQLFESDEDVRRAIREKRLSLPLVQKSRTAGYDGRGVAVIRTEAELDKRLLPGPCLVEDLVPLAKELAVIVARNENGEVRAFPAVEMEFNPVANLVEFLSCPAEIDASTAREAEELASALIKAFDICGLLAVEFFLTPQGRLLINEVAPRPHNSGHHTIDSCYTSQFEQHLRGILNLPLGSTRLKSPSVMVNLLGAEGYSGPARYEGLEECMQIEGVRLHLYGKALTKPFRKMGHATILAENLPLARERARAVMEKLQIIS